MTRGGEKGAIVRPRRGGRVHEHLTVKW
jgi:hypothetical protein